MIERSAAEAIAVFKLLFFRGKDRVDMERLVAVHPELDRAYIRGWIVKMMGEARSARRSLGPNRIEVRIRALLDIAGRDRSKVSRTDYFRSGLASCASPLTIGEKKLSFLVRSSTRNANL